MGSFLGFGCTAGPGRSVPWVFRFGFAVIRWEQLESNVCTMDSSEDFFFPLTRRFEDGATGCCVSGDNEPHSTCFRPTLKGCATQYNEAHGCLSAEACLLVVSLGPKLTPSQACTLQSQSPVAGTTQFRFRSRSTRISFLQVLTDIHARYGEDQENTVKTTTAKHTRHKTRRSIPFTTFPFFNSF